MNPKISPRQLAFFALQDVYGNKAYTDIALERILSKNKSLNPMDKGLISELVYGIVRRKRTLDSLVNQLGTKKASQQPLPLRVILHLGLYQLRYLDKIPPSAAVNTSVELAKENGLSKLSGVVNGILRSYLRKAEIEDPLILPSELIPKLGVKYSFPDWIVEVFLKQLNLKETKKLLRWYNESPSLDIRVNSLKTTAEEVQNSFAIDGIESEFIPHLPQGLRLSSVGNIRHLKGFREGLFSVQDSSAQLVSHFLAPRAGESVFDACAAPGGKTTHMAELMGDEGLIVACDNIASRLEKVRENVERLGLKSVDIIEGDSSNFEFLAGLRGAGEGVKLYDKILIDAPCSGLGTLHKRPDIRWQQKPEKILELAKKQLAILSNMAKGVKDNGCLVYATCTLNPRENEEVIEAFLASHPDWHIVTERNNITANFPITSKGAIKIFPHRHNMDGFFMIKLAKG
ncbi:16S rRNA (cytosine(967)-C(5))-methyltransferase [Cyanobacterium stanieri LEGE 03274]|uniref:16S rRNA (cytosine(967)-C(5))-methyltransferase n=1 Tax=Cyanobacterium stanieri LEGE 03274 TaxID=1828756 RepID=A0ABR9V5I3_9CHRO|nr:16S rRNA (cytosine(967)-C(5))-methyltransferase [Cyanobacterium stanieri]MBE9223152.1 16S rRNA (cytosine(967)-C(5))-methyltransferase [Cyanobacterium stanieri LEGE 03274]